MLVTAILILISVVLIVHVAIIAFKQKKKTDMIIDLYDELMAELEKEKRLKSELKNERKRNES